MELRIRRLIREDVEVLAGVLFRRPHQGSSWWWVFSALSQLLFAGVIFLAFSGLFPRIGSQGGALAFGVSVYSGIVMWAVFQDSLLQGLSIYDECRGYLLRFRIPIEMYGVAAVCPRVMTMAIGTAVLVGVRLIWFPENSLRLALAPAVLLFAIGIGLGALWIAGVVSSFLPQVRSLIPQLMLLWFFGTPIVYPRTILPEAIARLAALNPMTYVVETFQWLWLPAMTVDGWHFVILVGWSAGLFLVGYFLTRRGKTRVMDAL